MLNLSLTGRLSQTAWQAFHALALQQHTRPRRLGLGERGELVARTPFPVADDPVYRLPDNSLEPQGRHFMPWRCNRIGLL